MHMQLTIGINLIRGIHSKNNTVNRECIDMHTPR